MAERLLGNLYQVGGGAITHPLDGASYLLVDHQKGEHALIDCGSTLGYRELDRQVKQCTAIGGIAVIYATHGHFDHIAAKKYLPDAVLYIHENDHAMIARADPEETAAFLFENETFPELSGIAPLPDGYEKVIGDMRVKARHTPGHTSGSSCLELEVEKQKILVAWDTLWGCYHPSFGSNLDDWDDSLAKLDQDHFDYVTFGHCITRLEPNVAAHIKLARSVFRANIQPSHEGRMFNPWVKP